MRRLALVVVIAGCRFGFDERISGDTPDAPDAIPGAHCSATKIAGYDLGATGMTDVAAAQLADGYAVGTTTTDSMLFGVHLDPQLVPNTPTPFQTTPATGNIGHYSNGSLYFDGTNLVGALTVTDGTSFLKTFVPDMTSFATYVSRTGRVGEPSVARSNGTLVVSTWFHDNVVQYIALLADGTPDGLDRVVAAAEPANVVAVTAASGPSAIVAWELANGLCNLGAINDSLIVTGAPLAPACHAPYIHGDAADAVVAYERSGSIELRTVVATALPTLAVGTPVTFGNGSRPAVWRIDGNRWVAWRDASRLHISAVSAIADATIENLPSGPPDAYEPAGPYLFAIWGSELWAITCP